MKEFFTFNVFKALKLYICLKNCFKEDLDYNRFGFFVQFMLDN